MRADTGRGIAPLRLNDNICRRIWGKLFHHLRLLHFIRDDKNILRLDEITDALHGILNHRISVRNLE